MLTSLSLRDRVTWLVHTVLVAVLIWHHEPWRDELQAWSIAGASKTPFDVFANTRLEGRPPGWQLLLWPFAQLTSSPRMMQVVAFVVGAVAVWWWLRIASLDWRLKAVVLFGFYFTGGYIVHARDYVLSFLVLTAAVAVYARRGVSLRLAGVLCVLAFVNAFSLAMAAAFVAAAWLPELFGLLRSDARRRLLVVGSLAVCTAWFGWAAYLTYPTADNQFGVGQYKGFGRALTRSFIPLNYETAWLQRIDNFVAGALLVAVLAFAWSRSRVAFTFVLLSMAMLLYNLTYGYGDYWWHFGSSAFVTFAAACFPQGERRPVRGSHLVANPVANFGMVGLVVLALVNLAATRFGAGPEVYTTRPYSMTLPAAQQIQELCPDCTIIVDWDAIGAGISAQLGGRELYYLNRGEFGTFAKFSNKNIAPTWEDGLEALARFDRPLLIQTVFMTGPPPNELELIGVHLDGTQDQNLIWQWSAKRIIPDD